MYKMDKKRVLICLARGYMQRHMVFDGKNYGGRMIGFRFVNGKVIPIHAKKDDSLKKYSYEHKKHDTIWLKENEYAHVVSEISKNFPKGQETWEVCSKDIDGYTYTFRNLGFGEYEIIGKQKIR